MILEKTELYAPFQQKSRNETVPISKSDRGSDRQTLKSKIEQGVLIYEPKEKFTFIQFDNIEFDKKFTCTNLRIYESKEKSTLTFVKNVNL